MLKETYADLAVHRHKLQKAMAEAETKRPKPSAVDIRDAYTAVVDVEMGRLLRSMDPAAREMAISRDMAFAAAVIRLPEALSGATASQIEMAMDSALEREEPEKMAALREEREAMKWADEALEATSVTFKQLGDFAHDGEYRKLLAEALEPVKDKLTA
jgi:hypothetical protein